MACIVALIRDGEITASQWFNVDAGSKNSTIIDQAVAYAALWTGIVEVLVRREGAWGWQWQMISRWKQVER
jgi:hypothetical protein